MDDEIVEANSIERKIILGRFRIGELFLLLDNFYY